MGSKTSSGFDALERGVTNALLRICDSAVACGFTDNPLAIVCRSIVASIPEISFAAYVEERADIWRVAAVRPGYAYEDPSMAVARKFTLFLRERLGEEDSVALSSKETAPFVPAAKRRTWRSTTCLAFAVKIRSRRVALVTLFCPDELELTLRDRRWLDVFSRLASVFCSRQEQLCQMRERYEMSETALRTGAMALEAARESLCGRGKAVRPAADGLDMAAGTIRTTLDRAERQLGFSDILLRLGTDGRLCLRSDALSAWVERWIGSPNVKAIVGLRGTVKLGVLHAIREWVIRARGVNESAVLFIDCEDANFRQYRSADDMISFLEAFQDGSPEHFLFLNEIASVPWQDELFRRLRRIGVWNVWVTSSTRNGFCGATGANRPEVAVYRLWTDPRVPRMPQVLERVWCQCLVRDVSHIAHHVDLRAIEAVAEHHSDHLGESMSLRQIVADLKEGGVALSPNSVRAYQQALVSSFLIETVPVYDVFERAEVRGVSMRVFWTDLELRNWRFGPSREYDGVRLALNRLYLELRQKHGAVYTPRGEEGDFLALEPNGRHRIWKLPLPHAEIPPFLA